MSTHTAIATTAKGQFDVIKVPTESPGNGEVLLKVEYSSMITSDTYMVDSGFMVDNYPFVLGFNASGTIAEVGPGVDDLKVGDRVTAFSYILGSRSKGMQEYSIQPRTVCAKIPDSLPLDAAATIPDNFVTAFYTLFNQLAFPLPEAFPATTPPPLASEPILVYGAGATAGQFIIQLLHLSGYKNIIVTASTKHHQYLRSLGATLTIDYKDPDFLEQISKAAGGKLKLVIDCITADSTLSAIAKIVETDGSVAVLLPLKEGNTLTTTGQMYMKIPDHKNPLPKGTKLIGVRTFLHQSDEFLKANLMPKILPKLLEGGYIQPNHVRLLDEGSFKERVGTGLDLLRNNRLSGEKVVVKVRA